MPRQLVFWVAVALVASALLLGVLWWEHRSSSERWSALPTGSAVRGARLFLEKGCARCHAADGRGGSSAKDLGAEPSESSSPDQLVVAMWNHAPRMWDRVRAEQLEVPDIDAQEMADLLAYVDAARFSDETGEPARGRLLFESKACASCHAPPTATGAGAPRAPEALRKASSTVDWVAAMWNHPSLPVGDERPRFEGREMNDLLAFLRGDRVEKAGAGPPIGDPDRGWTLFRQKGCASCHSSESAQGRLDPRLAPGRGLPPTIVQLAGTMWNHAGSRGASPDSRRSEPPNLDGRDVADLVGFLYAFRDAEPGGSAAAGKMLFEGRGCDRCHGVQAEGTRLGPRIRGRGRTYTSISFATALWRHGPRMYVRARELGLSWPELSEGDVGDLVTFLKSSPAGKP